MLTPTHEGEWHPLQQQLPEVSFRSAETGPYLSISGLRDFRYHSNASIAESHYLQADYHPADLTRVWVGLSHFGDPGLAHTFLSFEFGGGQYLVVSIEARLRPDQRYHPFQGLMRQYHRMLVWGTESDIIGLRSHIRGERVLLYPLRLPQQQAEGLLISLATETAELQRAPAFYNTLLDNCTTGLLKYSPNYSRYAGLLDYRVLLPGFVDGLLFEEGWIDAEGSLEELRQRAAVDPETSLPGTEHFSQSIRQGWNETK